MTIWNFETALHQMQITLAATEAFSMILAEHEAGTKTAPSERAVYTAAEARLLKVVQYITLKDMLPRLRGTPSG